MDVGAIISVANVDRKDVDFELNTVDEKKGYNADDKKSIRKSLRQRAAPMITTQCTDKGSRQNSSFCQWAPEGGRGPDPAALQEENS